MKKAIAIGAVVVLTLGGGMAAAAATVSMSVAAIFSGNGGCAAVGSAIAPVVGAGTLTASTTGGTSVTLGAKQLATAGKMLAVAQQMKIPQKGVEAMVMASLQESQFWIYANTSSYPESAAIPHDKDGHDHDSLGPLQQRPQSGWGTVAQLMDPTYAAQAFFGGPAGPNHGSPRGVLDIPGWESMTPGQVAQTVQVSAYPDAYDKWLPVADAVIKQLGGAGAGSSCAGGTVTGGIAMPLDPGFNMTDKFGPRSSPTEGASSWHPADDLQNWPNPCGRPVYAILPGTVTASDRLTLSVKSPDGFVVSYLHSHKSDRLVNIGDKVTMGEKITLVGDEAPATGCHLDLRINITGSTNSEVNGLQKAQDLGGPSSAAGFVDPEAFFRLYGGELCPTGQCKREY